MSVNSVLFLEPVTVRSLSLASRSLSRSDSRLERRNTITHITLKRFHEGVWDILDTVMYCDILYCTVLYCDIL